MRADAQDIIEDIIQIEEDICYIQKALADPNITKDNSRILSENMEILSSVRSADIRELKDVFCIEYGS